MKSWDVTPQDMVVQLESEAKEDEEIYDKMVCSLSGMCPCGSLLAFFVIGIFPRCMLRYTA